MVSMLVDTCLGYVLMSFKLVFSTDNATSLGAAFRIRWGGCCGGCGNCVEGVVLSFGNRDAWDYWEYRFEN